MWRALGISRDPCGQDFDKTLYWESPTRRQIREEVEERLRTGRSVWLRGPDGSGRQSMLRRVAQDLVAGGMRVALLSQPGEHSPEALLAEFGHVVSAPAASSRELLDLCACLYQRLVDVFCEMGPCVTVFPWPLASKMMDEVGMLAELRLVGVPLVAIGAFGCTDSPNEFFHSVTLPEPSAKDFRDCLLYRFAVCGREDLLPTEILDRIGGCSEGFEHALRLAEREIARLGFEGAATASYLAETGETKPGLFDPSVVQEVDHLLNMLRPNSSRS